MLPSVKLSFESYICIPALTAFTFHHVTFSSCASFILILFKDLCCYYGMLSAIWKGVTVNHDPTLAPVTFPACRMQHCSGKVGWAAWNPPHPVHCEMLASFSTSLSSRALHLPYRNILKIKLSEICVASPEAIMLGF